MNFKNFNIKNIDKKTITYLGISIGAVILLIIFLLVLKIAVGSRINADKLEDRMKKAAISYYEENKDLLPNESGKKISISIDELVTAGKLKSLDKLLKKGVTCKGYVNVSNNNGYYLYLPHVDCNNDYKTNLLYENIIDSKNIVTTGNGLYKINDYYLFKGENINNYVKFANKTWRIMRINNDNTIRLILTDKTESVAWDDRYNIEKEYEIGKNDFLVSRIKDSLDAYFNDNNFTKDQKAMIVPQTLCIGKRNQNALVNDGSIECSKVLENKPLGLIQVNEYMLASLEPTCKTSDNEQCSNYNYLSEFGHSYWSLTSDSTNTYKVYKISSRPTLVNASSTAQLKLVVNITSDALYSKGNGTLDNPYIIK